MQRAVAAARAQQECKLNLQPIASITRPVMPFYNIVPHPTASGEWERDAGLGELAANGPPLLGKDAQDEILRQIPYLESRPQLPRTSDRAAGDCV